MPVKPLDVSVSAEVAAGPEAVAWVMFAPEREPEWMNAVVASMRSAMKADLERLRRLVEK